jgi:hypothetical protein
VSFTASFRGVCAACDELIRPGQQIESAELGSYRHAGTCPEVAELAAPTHGEKCPRCYCIHPGEC